MLDIKQISRNECAPFILGIHYAKRWPSISYAFGIFEDDELEGVVTYGTPSSSTLRVGIAGPEFKDSVLELNRLCLKNNKRNYASKLVGASLKKLPKNKVIVSFADTAQGHVGTVYQATNFWYCGLSAKRKDWKIKGMEHLHGQTIADMVKNDPRGRSVALRERFGDDFYLSPRSRKHRYITTTGSKTFRKRFLKALKYPVMDYSEAKALHLNVLSDIK